MIRSSLIISFLSLLVSVLGFACQVLIARYFGAGYMLDLYFTLSSVPVLVGAVVSSSLSYFLLPNLVYIKEKFENSSNIYNGKLLIKILQVFSVICGISFTLIFTFKFQLYPFIKLEDNIDSNLIIFISWVNVPFSISLGYFNNVYNSNKRFFEPVVLSFLPYLLSIISIICLNRSVGVVSIAVGLFAGNLIACTICILFLKDKITLAKPSETIQFELNNFLKKLPAATVAMLCFTIYQTIDSFWVSKLGVSYLSYISYCQRLVIALGAIAIVGPTTIFVPRLTESFAQDKKDDFYTDSGKILKIVFFISTIFCTIGSVLSSEIVQLLFMRGKFKFNDAIQVAEILPLMLIGMVFMLMVVTLFRMMFIKMNINYAAFMGIMSLFIYFTLSGVAVYFHSFKAICVSYIITWFVLFLLGVVKLFNLKGEQFYNMKLLKFFSKTLLLTLGTLLVSYSVKTLLLNLISFSGLGKLIITIALSGTMGLVVSAFLCYFLKIQVILNLFKCSDFKNFNNLNND